MSIFIQLVEISVRPPWPSLYLELRHAIVAWPLLLESRWESRWEGDRESRGRERKRERERGRRVEAGGALNNRFNWVMHEEVTYAKGLNLAARDLLPCLRSRHSPSLPPSSLSLSASSSVRSTLMTRTGIYSAQTVALNCVRFHLTVFRHLSKDLTKLIVRSVRSNWNQHWSNVRLRFIVSPHHRVFTAGLDVDARAIIAI